MSYTISTTTSFKKDFKKLLKGKKAILDKFDSAYDILESTGTLPFVPYKSHLLSNNYKGHMDAHIAPDCVLIYKTNTKDKEVTLVRIGSHSHIFDKKKK